MPPTRSRSPTFFRLLVALSVAVAGCSEPRLDPGPFLPYHGRHAEDPRLSAVLAEAPVAIAAAERQVSEALGLQARADGATWRLADRSSPHAPALRAGTTFPEAGRPRCWIQLEPVLAGQATLRELVAHELTHVALGTRIGPRSLPPWLDEGLAVHAAGQAQSKRARSLAWTEVDDARDVLAARAGSGLGTQLDGIQSIDYLMERAGPEAVRRLVARLCNGDDWRDALERVSGLSVAQFRTEATREGRSAWARLAGDGEPAVRRAQVALDAGRFDEAVALSEAARRADGGPFQGTAAWVRARSHLSAGRPAEAEEELRFLLDPTRRTTLGPLSEILHASAHARALLDDFDGARARCRELIDHDPWREHLADDCRTLLKQGR